MFWGGGVIYVADFLEEGGWRGWGEVEVLLLGGLGSVLWWVVLVFVGASACSPKQDQKLNLIFSHQIRVHVQPNIITIS